MTHLVCFVVWIFLVNLFNHRIASNTPQWRTVYINNLPLPKDKYLRKNLLKILILFSYVFFLVFEKKS